MKRNLFFVLMLAYSFSYAQDKRVEGKWLTYDDESGEQKATITIYIKGDKLYGKITEITEVDHRDELCNKCPGNKKGKPMMGLQIISDLTWNKGDKRWDDGEVLEADTGKLYDCAIWLDDKNPDLLYLRGYVSFFYRTQEWKRSK